MRKFLFIRNDDVWKLERSFREFFDMMLAYKIPIVYGVIPARLEKSATVFLRKAKEKTPDLLDIVQHGYLHRNYAPPGEDKYEFGAGRTYAQQRKNIEQGMKIMRRSFGDLVTPGFIPPYHAEDENTIKALESLKVPLYSARLKVPKKKKTFIDLPAQVWANKVDIKGDPKPLDFRRVSADLFDVLSTQKMSGMVFRHHMMCGASDKKVLMALMQLIMKERAKGKVQTVLFSDILSVRKK